MDKQKLVMVSILIFVGGFIFGFLCDHFVFEVNLRKQCQAERESLAQQKRAYEEMVTHNANEKVELEKEIAQLKEDRAKVDEYMEKLYNIELTLSNPSTFLYFALGTYFVVAMVLCFVVWDKNKTTNENLINLAKTYPDKTRTFVTVPTVSNTGLLTHSETNTDSVPVHAQIQNQATVPQLECDVNDETSSKDEGSTDEDTKNEGSKDEGTI